MAFDLCVIPASVVPYLSELQTRKFSITEITAHLVSEKLTREQCRFMSPDTFASSYGSSSHELHVRSSVSSEINLAITSSVSGNAPSGYTIVIQGYLNDHNSHIVLGVCVSDEPIVADASLRMFVNIEETNNVFRLRADFDGMVTQGLLDDILEQSLAAYPTIASYNSSTKKITFRNASNTELPNMEIDASAFIKDGMVYVGKVPVDESGFDPLAFSGLVGIDRDTGKFSQLFEVSVTENGAGVISPRLKENSPIYACFQGDCFAAHPKVPFENILRIYDVYGQGTLSTNMLPFTYYPFDAGDTVDAHVVTNTSSPGSYKYFQVDNCPVYIQVESNRVLLGNPPADIPARLIGFMCSGAENAGMIRLVESADVSYMSDNEYSKTFAGVWDGNSVDSDNYELSHVVTSLSYLSDNVLVGLSKNSSKLVPLLVDDACNGDVTINPNLDWDSPVYVLFAGYRCFSAHPLVDFRQILKFDNGSFMFTFSPMGSVGSETPSVADGDDGKQYFGSANYPVFISDFQGYYAGSKSFCVGIPSDVNIPSSDLHWRLLGYTTSKPGYIRLTESHPFLKDFIHQTGGYVKLSDFTTTVKDESTGKWFTPSEYVKQIQKTKPEYNLNKAVQELVSNYGEDVFHIKDLNASSGSTYAKELNGEVYVGLPSMTTVEFTDRVSFRTSTGEAAYIDSNGVYHGDSTGISSTPSLRFYPATSGTSGGTLDVSVGGKTSSSVAISPVRCAYEATTLATSRTVDGMLFNGSGNITHYGTCASSAATVAKVVTLAGFELATGARISVKFTSSNTATNPTLNVNGTGAKAIVYRGTSSVSGSSDYYRWQSGDIVDFIYDGTNWVMVGWQTYAYHAESATSASTSTYATYLRYSTTDLLTASDASTVTSSATIRPSSDGGFSLGSPSYKWGAVYANFIGSSTYPVGTAYIKDMQGTALKATSDASGNTITSTYLKSITLVNSSGADLSDSGTVGVKESGTYVVPNKWPVSLRLTKGSNKYTDIGLRSLLCSYLMGIPRNNTSTSSSALPIDGAEGCLAILQVYRNSPSDTIHRGRLVSSYSTVSVRGIAANGESGSLAWTSGSTSVSGVWVAINYTATSSGSYNYCMVLAVRIW